MFVDYRLLHATEIDAAADLWGDLHGDPRQHKAWRREFRRLPQLLTHTRVAVAADGALLSIIHARPLTVYGVDGQPQHVGRLSHVFTRPDVRRQGYASRLLEMTLAAMRGDGCLWSLLRTSEARALYGRYGWQPLPVRQIACTVVTARPTESAAGTGYTALPSPWRPATSPGCCINVTMKGLHHVDRLSPLARQRRGHRCRPLGGQPPRPRQRATPGLAARVP